MLGSILIALLSSIRKKTVSRSELDTARANLHQVVAEADNIRAVIAKKTIRAPFAGRLGIRQVDLGQILSEGDGIVSLQALGPVLVNFLLPQRQIAQITTGTRVRVTTDTRPDTVSEGIITAINSEVDAATRNIRVQATVSNPDELLRPGMYVNVVVVLSDREDVLTILLLPFYMRPIVILLLWLRAAKMVKRGIQAKFYASSLSVSERSGAITSRYFQAWKRTRLL